MPIVFKLLWLAISARAYCFARQVPCFWILFFVFAGLSPANADWQTEKAKDGIVVRTRSVQNSGYKEFQGTVSIKTKLVSLLALLDDASAYTSWMPNCLEARVIARKNARDSHIYTLRKAPWPIENRDMIIHTVTTRNSKTGEITISMESAADMVPKRADAVRVDRLRGFWLLKPRGDQVDVIYQVHADLGGNVPEWLVNSTSVDQPYKVLSNIRRLVASEKYANIPDSAMRNYEK